MKNSNPSFSKRRGNLETPRIDVRIFKIGRENVMMNSYLAAPKIHHHTNSPPAP
jgi:hypothetical protein